MTIFYFTGTGNSLAVAKSFGGELYSIPQILKEKRTSFKDDAIGLVYPVYSINTPNIVKRFLKEVKWEAKYTFAIATYGNTSVAATNALQKFAEQNGKHFDYINALLMVDNFLPMFEMKNQLDSLPQKKVQESLAKIKQDIDSRTKKEPQVSFLGKIATSIAASASKSMFTGHFSDKYSLREHCGGCGTCSLVCPTGNCTIVNKKAAFGDKCDACLACVQACPQNALHLKGERSDVRFRNKDVTLSELVKANRQI